MLFSSFCVYKALSVLNLVHCLVISCSDIPSLRSSARNFACAPCKLPLSLAILARISFFNLVFLVTETAILSKFLIPLPSFEDFNTLDIFKSILFPGTASVA